MFVVSKIDIKLKQKTPYQIEPYEKQVFFEFEPCKNGSNGFEIYKLHRNADEDFNIIATDAEMAYC